MGNDQKNRPERSVPSTGPSRPTVLRDKANFDVLEGFPTALLGRPIAILDMLESEGNQRIDADKYNRLDLMSKTSDSKRIIVEARRLPEKTYLERLAYGAARTIMENIKLGESYDKVTKVYSVSLLYFGISQDDDYIYHGRTEFTGLHTHRPARLKQPLVDEQASINETNVFPEYYLIPLNAFGDIVRDDLDQWTHAFKNNEVPEEFTAPGIQALKDKFDYLGMDETERRGFDRHMDYARSEWGIEHARWEGIEQGERRKAMEIALALRQKGCSPAQIAETTGDLPAGKRRIDWRPVIEPHRRGGRGGQR
uniref:PD-(D/E)XK nuclease family transposase n=1 Tax=Candidatus Kentrum sp. TC TaxID=2126339 RepID=A0A450YK82_9GAMM|nr:MAG: conserved hypothetical protein (putative transposase or invertase) [Candidatus Kentron sp. TC]